MLDAAMAHAIFGIDSSITRLSSLEISTRYESATCGEQILTVTGRIRKVTRSIVFLDGEIHDEQGNLTATAQSTAKIARSD
jgi:acyl-coenzyme A thioesterase PaaI-like protein